METPEEVNERNRLSKLSKAYVSGERIPGIRFRHNSLVTFVGTDGVAHEGWIVRVEAIEPEPVYTVERRDGNEDAQLRESNLELIHDPHERPTT
jgi:hypothetical protein